MRQGSSLQQVPIERGIEVALRPRAFIRDGKCFCSVSGLEVVASRIEQLIEGEPKRACARYETFLAGCTAPFPSNHLVGCRDDWVYSCSRPKADTRAERGKNRDNPLPLSVLWVGFERDSDCRSPKSELPTNEAFQNAE